LVQDGVVVVERVFKRSGVVTIGRSERNDLILYDRGAPYRLPLFGGRKGRFELLFDESMTGRVAIGDDVMDLEELAASGLAAPEGGRLSAELDAGARGRLVFDDFTVLFQVLEQPTARPRPTLPAVFRGGPWSSADRRVLPFLLTALLFHGGLIAYWETTDWPLRPLIDPLVAGADLVTVVPEPRWIEREEEEDPGGEWIDAEEDEWDELKENRSRSIDRKHNRKQHAKRPTAIERAEQHAALLTEIRDAAQKQAGVLGSRAALGTVFGSGPTGSDMERLIGDLAYGVAERGHSALGGLAGGKNTGEMAGVDVLKLRGGDRNVATEGAGDERRVGQTRRGKLKPQPSSGYLSEADVNRIVKRALPAIKGCYERALPRDPTLGGRLAVRFTVAGSGKVSSAQIVGNELGPQVGQCVAGVFKRLRFPEPQGGAARFEHPFHFTPAF
jgi:hypothetical protein